jgi:soluble lytic murein transglycosylase-like protein
MNSKNTEVGTAALLALLVIVVVTILYKTPPEKPRSVTNNIVQVYHYNPTARFVPVDLKAPVIEKAIRLSKNDVNSALETSYGLPIGILEAVHLKETSGNCNSISSSGAEGCFQFMPITMLDLEQRFSYKFNPYNYNQSAKAAAIKLQYLHDRFNKAYELDSKTLWSLSLAAYNAGYTNVMQQGWADNAQNHKHLITIINFPETKRYVNVITSKLFEG